MTEKLTKKFDGFCERKIHVSVVLDKRSNKNGVTKFPAAVRFSCGTSLFYIVIGGEYTPQEFSDICNTGKSGSKFYAIQKQWREALDKYEGIVRELNIGGELTLEMVKAATSGRSAKCNEGEEVSFLSIWKEIIDKLKNSDRYSTGENYERGYASFVEHVGMVKGFAIDKSVIEKWDRAMRTKPGRNGRLLSEATIGMHMRSFRLAWLEVQKRGYMKGVPYPFSNKRGSDLITIPRGGNRKDHYLNVDKMTELYNVFVEKRYPDTWSAEYTKRAHYSLGLFLAQYLCNGFNLADAGELRYDNYYFSSEGEAFRFNRMKTAGRSDNGAEVFIPIIEPLQYILDEIAAIPVKGGYVFPHILEGATDAKMIRKRLSQENSNVKDRMHKICKEVLGWDNEVSGTWARHSFATNLRNAGVDMQYISESMGHAIQKSVTDIYLAAYPIDIQKKNNKKLLNIKYSDDMEPSSEMSQEDIKRKMAEMEAELAKLRSKLI